MTAHDRILLGHAMAGGARVEIDVDKLLRTELLIQAASGGGKSWVIRRLAEQAFQRQIPHVIIDPEDEFSSLRERFDFLLIGPDGDAPADVRSAPLLARRILETGVSAVCSLFHLRWPDRQAWVAAFLEALVNAPKDLWRDLLVTLDEAHKFCPEQGRGEAASTEAVSDLATLGRKRGFGARGRCRSSPRRHDVGRLSLLLLLRHLLRPLRDLGALARLGHEDAARRWCCCCCSCSTSRGAVWPSSSGSPSCSYAAARSPQTFTMSPASAFSTGWS